MVRTVIDSNAPYVIYTQILFVCILSTSQWLPGKVKSIGTYTRELVYITCVCLAFGAMCMQELRQRSYFILFLCVGVLCIQRASIKYNATRILFALNVHNTTHQMYMLLKCIHAIPVEDTSTILNRKFVIINSI